VSEKTEEPTPRRLQKARDEGNLGISAFASQSLGFLVAVILVDGAIASTSDFAADTFRTTLAEPTSAALRPEELPLRVLALSFPLLGAVAITSAAASLVQTGAVIAPARLLFKLERLNPAAGLRGLFSPDRLFVVARALLTAAVVAWLAWSTLRDHAADLARSIGRLEHAALVTGALAKGVAMKAALVGLVVGAVDWLVTRRSWLSKLRMTKAEVKREHKETEGDPLVKAARERARMEMLTAATIQAVREATVVIVNPQHLATALRYVDGEDEAPKVLANGEGELAKRIQEAARAWGIPIVRDVPVARALRELQPGDEIPEALYEAVAEILREVWDAEEAERLSSGEAPST